MATARYDWRDVDWSENDERVSQTVGCAESTARNKRKELGLPPNSRKCNGRYRKTQGIDWKAVDWSLSERKIAAQLGISRGSVRRAKRVHAPAR